MTTSKQTTRARKPTKSTIARGVGRRKRPTRDIAFARINERQVEDLVLQALETELIGVQVYETALRCVQNDDLREEWETYRDQTQRHVEVVQALCTDLGIDAETETPGRAIVRHIGESLVAAMEQALDTTPGDAAQIVAAECVTLAETKDHQNWVLIGELCDAFDKSGDQRCEAFEDAYDEVEDEEDQHLDHTAGWSRELWIESLGLPAVLPPPEEKTGVRSMVATGRAKAGRNSRVPAKR